MKKARFSAKQTAKILHAAAAALSRRHFLKISAAAGGGLLIGFYLPDLGAASMYPTPKWGRAPSPHAGRRLP